MQNVCNRLPGKPIKNIEHIIIDGGSKDKTIQIIKSASSVTKYLSEPDKVILEALDEGIKLASGEVIGFLPTNDMNG